MRNINARLRVLSDHEMQLLHGQSLRILDEIGIHTPNDEMLSRLEAFGCIVDRERQIVRYPKEQMEEFLGEVRKKAPPKNDEIVLEKQSAGISTEIFLIDYLRRENRPGTLDDIKKGIALLDKMENFSSADAVVVPSDVPSAASDLIAFQMMYTYSRKPGGTYILNAEMAPLIIEMARAAHKKAWYLLDTVSPLKIRKESLDAAMIFAREKMPISFCSMVTAMGSAPVTMAGAMAMQNAEHLCGMVMLTCLGQEVGGYPGVIHPMDPSTLICSFGAPSLARSSVACAQMARFYGLTPGGNIALTDALLPDFQGGFEKAFSLMLGSLAGLRGVGGQGIVGADQGNSFEQIVIDNEWLGAYNDTVKGVEITEETIGYEAIERIGRNGSYLEDEHTFEHLREEIWPSKLFLREPWDSRVGAGKKDLLERAHDRVEEITQGYRSMEPVIPEAMRNEIDRIAKEGLKRIGYTSRIIV